MSPEPDNTGQSLEAYKHLQGWVKRLAGIDPPTGLLNRHGWIAVAERIIKRAARGQQSLGLILAQVDGFVRLTEDLGFEAADNALQQVADLVEGQIRPGDLLGWWQEARLVLLLPSVEATILGVVAERIRGTVEALSFEVETVRVPLKVSVGGASLTAKAGDLMELDTLISRADDRVRQAIEQGGNRVVL